MSLILQPRECGCSRRNRELILLAKPDQEPGPAACPASRRRARACPPASAPLATPGPRRTAVPRPDVTRAARRRCQRPARRASRVPRGSARPRLQKPSPLDQPLASGNAALRTRPDAGPSGLQARRSHRRPGPPPVPAQASSSRPTAWSAWLRSTAVRQICARDAARDWRARATPEPSPPLLLDGFRTYR